MFKKPIRFALILAAFGAFALGIFALDSYAQSSGGRVDITPQRVVLGPRDRSGEITLLNLGDNPGTIRVSLLNYKQNENGIYETLEHPLNPAFDPEQILRLSPRQFTLPAGGRQTVRFSIRKPADLPEGEYRFHIQAIRLMESGPPKPLPKGEKGAGMIPNFGAAIPVIIRHGQTSAQATLSDLQYVAKDEKTGKAVIKMDIHRTGNAGILGRAEAMWIPVTGKPEILGIASNLNVFTEVNVRHASIQLANPVNGPGEFRVVYINEETKEPYANATLQMP